MARHAILIGVGGTGQYVLTLVKKELMEAHGGKVPSNVRLLAFDTMPEASAGGNKDLPENIISIGNVQLERNVEFFPLMGNGWEIGEQIVRGQAKYLGRKVDRRSGYIWFDAEEYRRSIPPALWDLAAGAGRIRQFGRLSFFMKIDDIRHRLELAFAEVQARLTANQELEVIIVSSFAGGTGAGMFIDMGVLCRDLGKSINNHMIIRGFFILPRAFANPHGIDEEGRRMMARSFAAWRELDRFMNLGPDYGAHTISYRAENQLDIPVSARPFDVCYLVDSKSSNYSLENVPTEHGVFPATSNYISLILDEKAGPLYSLDTRNFIQNQGRTKPGYCAFRTHTIKVPIYYDLELCALSFAQDLMETWLVPIRDARKNVTGLADNQNNEQANTQGRDQVIPFLKAESMMRNAVTDHLSPQGSQSGGENLHNSLLLPHIAQIYSLRTNPSKMTQQLDEDVTGGFSTVNEDGTISPTTYVGRLAILPSDANRTMIEMDGKVREPDAQMIVTEAGVCVWDEVKPSSQTGESPVYAPDRFKDQVEGIEAFVRKHYGAGAGNRGKFGYALEESRRFQVKRFRELLRQWLLNTLNGTVTDPRLSLSGKLGYASDFCQELVKALDSYRAYLEEVKKRRDNKQILEGLVQDEEYFRQDMELHAGDKCVFFFTHPYAYVTQERYLLAVDRRLQYRKDEMVLETMSMLTSDLITEARGALAAVERWVASLATGGQAAPSLIREIAHQVEVINGTMAQERLDMATQVMTPEAKYQKRQGKLDEELRRVSWDIQLGYGFEINCKLFVPVEVEDSATNTKVVNNRAVTLKPGDTFIDLQHNLAQVMTVARAIYSDLRENRRVLDEVQTMQPYLTPTGLANDMVAHSDVLVDLSAKADRQQHVRQAYLRVMDPANARSTSATDYLDKVKNQICATLGIVDGRNYRTLQSQDEYKLTLLHTIYRIQDTDFNIWSILRDQYLQHITRSKNIENSARLHIYPAECNSARYESKLTPLLNKGYRPFHPRVVMLLEHAERVSLFFRCLAYGFIRQEEIRETGERKYLLCVPRIGNSLPVDNILLVSNTDSYGALKYNEWPSAFEIVHAFAMVGHDARVENKIINWENLNTAIVLHESALREAGELDNRLRRQMEDSEGIVQSLSRIRSEKREAYLASHQTLPQGGWSWEDDGQDCEDLADLIKMMYMEVKAGQTAEITITNDLV